jgi:carboxyl-terminal processing protease
MNMPILLENEKRKMKKTTLIYLSIVAVLILFCGGFLLGRVSAVGMSTALQPYSFAREKLPEIFKSLLFETIWSNLSADFVGKDQIDMQKMYYGALSGFVAGAGDPYTNFFSPEETKEFYDDVNAEFEGIGAQVGMRDGRLTIISPMPDSPAEKAGILAGDKIYTIDGVDTTDMPLEKGIKLIRGPKGTVVTLMILRNEETPLEIKVTRDVIQIKSVEWTFRSDGILHIQLHDFYSDTERLFGQLAKEVKKNKPRGIILDMRNNPGGLLDAATAVASYWVNDGEKVLSEKFGDSREVVYAATSNQLFKGYKTMVLINGGSASAAEIVAGALKDYGLATLVGEKSFGKGSVQEIRRLSDGSSLKMTIAEWLTPNGDWINQVGIKPDVEIIPTEEDIKAEKDAQLDKAVELLK